MCGIAAVLGKTDGRDWAKLGATLTESLRHRGPDSHGSRTYDAGEGQTLLLAHTRLAILDLSPAGAQPMHVEGLGLAISYNGEIYNHRALRRELEAITPNIRFRSGTDTEVLLRGYAQWGTDVFGRIDGMFAAVIFDARARRLVVARDHLGIKPLYWASLSRPGEFAFASEVRSLMNAGLVGRRLDPGAVGDFLDLGSVAEPRTLLRGLEALPPGHWAEVSLDVAGPLRPRRYWSPWTARRRSATVEEHDACLKETVGEQLVADVPTGVFLSAGVDSTLLATLAARNANGRLRAFTIGSGRAEENEAALAAATARWLGLDHEVFDLADTQAAEWVRDGLDAMDQPSADGINTYLVSRASRATGIVAALAGTGADELHGGYPHYRALSRLSHVAVRMLTRLAVPGLRITGRTGQAERLALLVAAAPVWPRVVAEKRRFFTPSWQGASAPETVNAAGRAEPADIENLNGASALDRIALAELAGYLRHTLLRDSDWATMANGQELRVPFLGRRYVEVALGLPWALRLNPRGPNKPRLSNLLPTELSEVVRRPKTGFNLDYTSLMTGPLRASFLEAAAELGRLGFSFDGPASLAQLDQNRDPKLARRFWACFALGRYCARHGLTF